MSDASNPLYTLYENVKKAIVKQEDARKWIDFAKAVGEDVTQQEVRYRNNENRLTKYRTQLELEGFKF